MSVYPSRKKRKIVKLQGSNPSSSSGNAGKDDKSGTDVLAV